MNLLISEKLVIISIINPITEIAIAIQPLISAFLAFSIARDESVSAAFACTSEDVAIISEEEASLSAVVNVLPQIWQVFLPKKQVLLQDSILS